MTVNTAEVIRMHAERIVTESIETTGEVHLSNAVVHLKQELIFDGVEWKNDAELEEAIRDAWATVG